MVAVSFRLSDYRRIGQIIRLLSDCQIVRLSDYYIIRFTIFVNFRPSERTCYSKCEIGNQRTGLPVWGKKRIVLLFKTLFSGNKRNRQKIFFLPHDFGLIK